MKKRKKIKIIIQNPEVIEKAKQVFTETLMKAYYEKLSKEEKQVNWPVIIQKEDK